MEKIDILVHVRMQSLKSQDWGDMGSDLSSVHTIHTCCTGSSITSSIFVCRTTTAMADEQARKAERIRALLSGYYGGAVGDAPAAGGPAGASDRPLAKQSVPVAPILNPEEQHIADILRSYPLERLLTEHRSMAREIKNLDSDMQQLICEWAVYLAMHG